MARKIGGLFLAFLILSFGNARGQNRQWLLPLTAQTSDDSSVSPATVTLGAFSPATNGWDTDLEPVSPAPLSGLSLFSVHTPAESGYETVPASGGQALFGNDFRARLRADETQIWKLRLTYQGSQPSVTAVVSWPPLDAIPPNYSLGIGLPSDFLGGNFGTDMRGQSSIAPLLPVNAPVSLEVHIRANGPTPDEIGDLNDDGAFTALDLSTGMGLFLGNQTPTSRQLEMGDIEPVSMAGRGDGNFSGNDLNALLRRYLGVGGEALVQIAPNFVSLLTGASQPFTATASGVTDTGVTLSVQEGATGGTVAPAGVYTPPAASGFYQVVAASHADPTKKAVAIAQVTAVVHVDIQNLAFSPTPLTIARGTQVIWTNKDGFAHTVTSGQPNQPGGNPVPDGIFNSGSVGGGQTYSFTFNTLGTFNYFCQIHTHMRGQIIVQ